ASSGSCAGDWQRGRPATSRISDSFEKDLEAARVVAETPDAGRLQRPRAPLEDALDRAGDEAALEVAEDAPDAVEPAAGDALVDVDLDPGTGELGHLDDADLQRGAELEERFELGQAEREAELLAGDVGGAGGAAPDDVLERDQPKEPIERDAGVGSEAGPRDLQRVADVHVLVRRPGERATQVEFFPSHWSPSLEKC